MDVKKLNTIIRCNKELSALIIKNSDASNHLIDAIVELEQVIEILNKEHRQIS